MSFVLSSCLMFVKLAIAVTDGVYVMLSNVYSVIDSAANSEEDRQEITEHDSPERSTESFRQINRHSNILEAFNRRRSNFTRHAPFTTPFLVAGSSNISEDKRRRCPLREENASIPAIRHFRDIKDNVPSDGKDFLPNLTLSDVNRGCISVGTSTHIEDELETGAVRTSKTLESQNDTPSPKKSRSGKKASRSSSKKKSRNLKDQGKDSSNPSRPQARKSLTRGTRSSLDLSTTTDEDKFCAPGRIASAKQEFTENLKYCKFTPLSDSSGDRVTLRKIPRSPRSAAKSDSKASGNIDTVFQTSGECLPSFYNPRFDMVESKLEMTDTKMLKNDFDECNNYPSDGSNSDYAGFGYFSDDGPISSTKHLHSYVEKPAVKNNWSSMIELMAYEMQKKIRTVSNKHTDNLYDNSSPKTSVKSLDIDSGYTSLSKDSNTSPKVGPSTSYFPKENKVEQNSSSDNVDDTALNQSKNASSNGFVKASEVVASKDHFDEKVGGMTSNPQNVCENQTKGNIKNEHATTEVKDSQSLEKHNDTAESKGSRQLPQSSSVPNKVPANNIPIRDLVTEKQQMNFLDEITEIIHQQYKFDNRGENIPMEACPLLQDIEEHHYTILQNITEAIKQNIESEFEETVKDPLTKMKDFELDFSEFLAYNKTRGYTYGSANTEKLAESLPDDEELDEYGFPLSSSDDEDTTITNVEERRNSEGTYELILQRSNAESSSVHQNKTNSTDSYDPECSSNEASTPISEKKSISTTMDLSSCSNDSKPDICCGNTLDKFMNSTFTLNEKDEIKKEISDLDFRVSSPETSDSEKDILDNSLGEKDWAECAAEVSKHYENCISFLEDDHIILNSTRGDDSGCDDSDYGNTSNGGLMEQIENEVDSIYANLLRPGEMDVDSLFKELDAAFSTPMDDKVRTKRDKQSDARVNGKDSGKEEKEFPSKCCTEIEDKNDEITFESETVHEERSQIDARVSKVNGKDSGMVEKDEQKELLSECCTEIENKSDEVVLESVTIQEEHVRNKNVAEELVKLERGNATKIALEEITVCEKYSAGDDFKQEFVFESE